MEFEGFGHVSIIVGGDSISKLLSVRFSHVGLIVFLHCLCRLGIWYHTQRWCLVIPVSGWTMGEWVMSLNNVFIVFLTISSLHRGFYFFEKWIALKILETVHVWHPAWEAVSVQLDTSSIAKIDEVRILISREPFLMAIIISKECVTGLVVLLDRVS